MIPIILEKTDREGENKIINARIVVVNLLNLILRLFPRKEACLYVNGNGFRAIERMTNERMTKVNHNTVIRWVKKLGHQLPDTNNNSQTPEVCELDELETLPSFPNIKISRYKGRSLFTNSLYEYFLG